jgi:hypothetical protein
MANGIEALRRIQIGAETVQGTPVVTTTFLRGQGTPTDGTEHIFPAENIGIVPGVDRSYVAQKIGTLAYTGVLTYEQLHPFQAALHTTASSADGVGTGRVWEYNLPTSSIYSASDLTTYTLRAGDNAGPEEMPFCFIPDFTIEGAYSQALTLSANWRGTSWTASSFDALSASDLQTIEEVLFNKGKLYIDDATGTIGTTLVSNTLLSMSLAVTTGWRAQPTADGTQTFSLLKQVSPEAELTLVFEHNTSAVAEKAAWRAGTSRLIRLNFEGAALVTPGTSFTYKTFRIDAAGKYASFAALSSDAGNDTISCTFRIRYNATAAKYLQITAVNELSALP